MRVRIKTKKTLFSKGDIQTVSRYIYQIIEKKGQKNTLKNLITGEEVSRTYTDEELAQTFERPERKPVVASEEVKRKIVKRGLSPEETIASQREHRVIKRPVWKSL